MFKKLRFLFRSEKNVTKNCRNFEIIVKIQKKSFLLFFRFTLLIVYLRGKRFVARGGTNLGSGSKALA